MTTDYLQIKIACDNCQTDESCYVSEIDNWVTWKCQICGQETYEINDNLEMEEN